MTDQKASLTDPYNTPRWGIALMVSMALLLPVMDTIGKYLTAYLSPGAIAFFRFIVQTTLFMCLIAVRRQFYLPKKQWLTLMALGALICIVMLSLMLGLSVLPLATLIAIFFVEPLILVFFSIIFLGEKVGWRRILACCVGLGGALIIIRPNYATFGIYALMPVITAVCMALYFTLTKRLQGKMDGVAVQAWATLFGTIFLGLAVISGNSVGIEDLQLSAPTVAQWGLLCLAAGLGCLAYVLIAEAFKRAPASLLAPFQYVEIIAATLLGYFVFGDFPDALTWLGITIILGAGLYVFYREQHIDQTED